MSNKLCKWGVLKNTCLPESAIRLPVINVPLKQFNVWLKCLKMRIVNGRYNAYLSYPGLDVRFQAN